MLKLSADQEASKTTLRVEGRIVGPWVRELREACDRVLQAGSSLTVDLGGVTFVDRQGAALCQRLRARGVALVNGSTFVSEQLKGDQS